MRAGFSALTILLGLVVAFPGNSFCAAAVAGADASVDGVDSADAGDPAAAARRDFLRAREAERAGRDAEALSWYARAFGRDPGSRALCFLYLDRLKDARAVDSAAAVGRRCAALAKRLTLDERKLLGEIALRADDAAGALAHYRAADSLDGEDGDVLYILAGLCEDAGDLECVASTVARLLPRLDYPPRLLEKLARADAMLGRPEAFTPHLRAAWERTGRIEYGRALAAAYEAEGRRLSLLATAHRLVERSPETAHKWLLARAYAEADRPDSALATCDRLLAEEPDLPGIRALRATLLFERGRYKEARREAEALARAYPELPAHAFLAGSAALELKSRDAVAWLDAALAAAPFTPEYRARRAYADYVFGHPEQAAARLVYTASDSLDAEQALLLEGLAHGRLARDLEPRGAWERPAALSDSSASRRHRRLAVERFEAILAKNSGQRAALFEAGAHRERLGDHERSKALMRRLVVRDTTHALAMNYLAYTIVEQDTIPPAELEEAGRLLERALALDPENGAFMDSKGWWHYRAGDYGAAVEWLERAAAAVPDDPAVLEHLALALHAMDRRGEACAAAGQALRIDPARRLYLHCPGTP